MLKKYETAVRNPRTIHWYLFLYLLLLLLQMPLQLKKRWYRSRWHGTGVQFPFHKVPWRHRSDLSSRILHKFDSKRNRWKIMFLQDKIQYLDWSFPPRSCMNAFPTFTLYKLLHYIKIQNMLIDLKFMTGLFSLIN